MKLTEKLKRRIKRTKRVEEVFAVMAFMSYFSIGLGMGLHEKVACAISIGLAFISLIGLEKAEERRKFYQKNLARAQERDERRGANYYFDSEKEAA